MKTIEERATDAAHDYRREVSDLSGERATAYYDGFVAGAESEHAELTRWHDPKEELPNDYRYVLVKVVIPEISDEPYFKIGYYMVDQWFGDGLLSTMHVIGWREIHK